MRPYAHEATVDAEYSPSPSSSASIRHIVAHIDPNPRETPPDESETKAELSRCDALVIVWSFGGVWFPHEEISRWLPAWSEAHPFVARMAGVGSSAWLSSSSSSSLGEHSQTAVCMSDIGFMHAKKQWTESYGANPYPAYAYRPMPTHPVFIVGNKADLHPQLLSAVAVSAGGVGDFATLAELEAFEEVLDEQLVASSTFPGDVFRLLLSYFSDRAHLRARSLCTEAEFAVARTEWRRRSAPEPLLFCSALTGVGVDRVWRQSADDSSR